ncbi:IDEAL domain-containing protein [Paenibacillus albus]|uniref:IDEAL domain-containing protein n=1 Tax=Paenibacillus albus TaxID=2495582 RepID=UPI0013DEAD99|nr:IDEAL domain-containing protein [Paenibacillus albus]
MVSANNPIYNGEIAVFKGVEYYFQLPSYVFESPISNRIIVSSEDGFEVLPYKSSLLHLIDLALDLQDEKWFEELVYKLNYESQ